MFAPRMEQFELRGQISFDPEMPDDGLRTMIMSLTVWLGFTTLGGEPKPRMLTSNS